MTDAYALVAQLDRVTGYEPVGRGFESLPAYQKVQSGFIRFGLFIMLWKCAQHTLYKIWRTAVRQFLRGETYGVFVTNWLGNLFEYRICLDEAQHTLYKIWRTAVRQILRGETYEVIVGKCLHFALITECVSTRLPFDSLWFYFQNLSHYYTAHFE